MSIDRKRKQPATMFLRALGIAETNEEIIELLGDSPMVQHTLARDTTDNRDDALVELYKRQRPGEPPTLDSAKALLDGLFFNQQRYDLASVGRYKLNKKLGLDVDPDVYVLTPEDIVAALRYLICLHDGMEGYIVDERDHFGNRRVRTVGELIANQFRVGLSRMERVVRERMASQEIDDITPQSLINIRPIVASIQGVLRLLPAVPVHGPEQPPVGSDPQASPVGPGPGRRRRSQDRLLASYQRAYRGARRPQLALFAYVPHRDPRRPQHRPDRIAGHLRPRQ